MKKIIIILTVILLASCSRQPKFVIEGTIEGGAGEMIYLEHMGLAKTTLLDSVRIDRKDEFHFRAPAPEYPDFYRLILSGRSLHFAVDSAEVLRIKSTYGGFSTNYHIEGSVSNADIQKLRYSVAHIQRKANQAIKGISQAEQNRIRVELIELIEEHKAMARPIILNNPRSSAAYFALFQQVNGINIFSPYEREDRPYFGAVATSFHTFMPSYDRSIHLHALVLDALNTEREARRQDQWAEMVANASTGYIDIALPDRNGNIIKLSSLEGKAILLDFSAYESRESVAYTFALRDLYNKYASRGFEIYQVSLDRNKMLWLDATKNIPWICVRDEKGPNTSAATSYNVSSLPTYFLIGADGVIVGRNLDLQTLEREISRNLP